MQTLISAVQDWPLYQLHPIAVHFPIALLLVGALFKVLAEVSRCGEFGRTSLWLLRLGALAALAAAALGLLAAHTAPHVPDAWETMRLHKRLGLSLAGAALALWGIEEFALRKPSSGSRWLARLLWIGVVVLIFAAGDAGGDLVYLYGVAVKTAPHI